jgi:iron complex transport system substrate-binding protein
VTTRTFTHRRRALIGGLALTFTLIAACGTGDDTGPSSADDDAAATSSAEGFPVTVLSGSADAGTEITIEGRPEAIVSLSPTATETLWAVGAEDQVVAVDDQSDYPEGVPTTALSGHQPNIEAILAYEPDLVLAADDMNDLVAGLEAAGVPTLLLPAATDLDDAYSQMERIGAATGHVPDAAALVADLQQAVEQATAQGGPETAGLTYFHELDSSLYTVTSDTFIGQLYSEFGLTSIGDDAGAGDDYPQISPEFVVEADPDLIVLADTEFGDVTVENVADRPGWADLTAIRQGNVVALDADIASRWGPRIAEFAELIGDQVAALDPAPAG